MLGRYISLFLTKIEKKVKWLALCCKRPFTLKQGSSAHMSDLFLLTLERASEKKERIFFRVFPESVCGKKPKLLFLLLPYCA